MPQHNMKKMLHAIFLVSCGLTLVGLGRGRFGTVYWAWFFYLFYGRQTTFIPNLSF